MLIDEGYHKRGVPIETLAAATSRNVAALYSVQGKGRIVPGFDADLVVVDPEGQTHVDPANYPSHSDYSPFEGMTFRGAITHTILRGQVMVEGGALVANLNAIGRYMQRDT